ncbi:MAG TPA: tRNA pseudouridine(38-40) synthase TruA [Tepidisphaeraceae bacterium]|jgi:tRNA pseudouridine38-40 synthase|nr:tRNA pseudouridine(38-40) synthase TruA [Tepidisphaeraceae bacterium]
MPTQRYKLIVAYRGTAYHGWQWQPAQKSFSKGPMPREGMGLPTIQQSLSRALGRIIGHPVTVVGSSRTDAKVHAKGQVAHFDTDQVQIPPENIRRATNHQLPDDILIRSIEAVPDSFSAIASTESKRYQYLIWNTDDRPLFTPDLAWYRWQPLDIAAMQEAAKYFIGTHDFKTFARPGHGRVTTERTVLDCSVSCRSPRLVVAVEGKGFLWHMVRIMVGTLVEIGLGKHRPEAIAEMIAAKDRRKAGGTAPAHGLYLQWVKHRAWEGDHDLSGQPFNDDSSID